MLPKLHFRTLSRWLMFSATLISLPALAQELMASGKLNLNASYLVQKSKPSTLGTLLSGIEKLHDVSFICKSELLNLRINAGNEDFAGKEFASNLQKVLKPHRLKVKQITEQQFAISKQDENPVTSTAPATEGDGTDALSGKNIIVNSVPQAAATGGSVTKLVAPFRVGGHVSSKANNSALQGVTVSLKGTNTAATTNEEGDYSLTIPDGKGILVFSYIGYLSSERPVNNQQKIDVILEEDSRSMDQVVVVGYGVQKKVNLTGAVSQITSKMIEDRPVANIGQAIQGAVPNLNVTFGDGHPGSGATFNIRGTTSLNNQGPLVLVDGVPGDLNLINPQDVQSISVLKDAASSAIYGARGAFGVILITTKQAKKGKLAVNYSNFFSWQTPTVSTDFMTDGYTVAKIIDEAFIRATGKAYTGYSDKDMEELKKRQTDHSLPSVVVDNRNGRDQYVYYGNTDWWSTIFRDVQPSMQHAVSISGGSEKVDFYLSGRIYEQDGLMQINQDKYHAYNFRAKIDARVAPWLTVTSNTQFSANNYTFPGWGINNSFVSLTVHALPSYLPVNPDGTATYRTNLNNYTIGDGLFADLLHGKSKGGNKNFDLTNTIGVKINLTKDLSIIGNYTFNLTNYSDFQRRTAAPWSIYPGVIDYVGNDLLTENSRQVQYHVVNAYANYEKKLGNHNINLVAGYNQELNKGKNMFGSRANLLSEDLNQLDLGTGDAQVGSNATEWALLGFFGRASYNFKEKYLFELNGRYDGTSRFPKGSRFGLFPSVSAGWRVSEEPFFEALKPAISELKFRGSYGSLGNQLVLNGSTVLNYPYVPVINTTLGTYIINGTRTQYTSVPTPVSPNLTWEKTTSADLGIDFGLLKNRMQVSFDLYNRTTKDMLINGKTLPAVFGAGSPKQNAADLRTRGFDLSVAWQEHTKVAGKAFNYNLGIVLSDYTAQITKFDNPSNILSDNYVGKKYGEIWGYSMDGYFISDEDAQKWPVNQTFVNKGIISSPGEWSKLHAGDIKFKDLNGDGIINNGKNTLSEHGDIRILGNSLPRYAFGINGGASWNGFDLSVFFQGIGKQNWYPGSDADKYWGPYSRSYFSFIPKGFESKIWSADNPNAYFPVLRGYEALNANNTLNSVNDRYMQDLAYIRLKNLTLGYSLPASLLQGLRITKCRVYFGGENIVTFTKLDTKYIDPEQAAAEKNGRVYPFMKTFSFGLDLNF